MKKKNIFWQTIGAENKKEYRFYSDGLNDGFVLGRKFGWYERDCAAMECGDALVVFKDNSCRIVKVKEGDTFSDDCRLWAYIDDLIPIEHECKNITENQTIK